MNSLTYIVVNHRSLLLLTLFLVVFISLTIWTFVQFSCSIDNIHYQQIESLQSISNHHKRISNLEASNSQQPNAPNINRQLLSELSSCDEYIQFPFHMNQSIVTELSELGLPSASVLWTEPPVRCDRQPYPMMVEPQFVDACILAQAGAGFQPLAATGMHGMRGFAGLCADRDPVNNQLRAPKQGAALIELSNGFIGPVQGVNYVYNRTHAVRMNPWFSARQGLPSVPTTIESGETHCYEELAVARSVYDDTVGPHPVLEVASIVAFMLDALPSHIPIAVFLDASMEAMYRALNIDTARLIPFVEGTIYFAKRMYWMRRPEEYSMDFWQPLRQRIQQKQSTYIADTFESTSCQPFRVVILQRLKQDRSLTNHDEFVHAVRANFRTPKYEISLFNGSLSLADSVLWFQQFDLLIGPHGGAFLNGIFLRSGASVIEIAYPGFAEMPFPTYFYSQLVGLGIDYWIEWAIGGEYTSPMTVNITSAIQTLQHAISYKQQRDRANGIEKNCSI